MYGQGKKEIAGCCYGSCDEYLAELPHDSGC